MPKSKTEAVLKEDHARTKAAEIQLREQQSKVRVEEAKKWAEDTRQEEKVEQQEEARRKGGEIDRPNKESVKEEQRNVEDNEHDWDEDIDDEINVAVAARWSELRRELDRQGLSSGQKQGVNEALLKEIFPDACTVFKTVFSDKTEYKNLLRLEQRTVQSLLDVMQTILDYAIVNVSDSKFERYLLKAMLRLSKQSALYPSSYILTGIKRDAYPIASGYFGEIFKGEINGRKLALKVFKLYANEMDKINDLLKASIFYTYLFAFYKEAILWRHLVHPNLLPFYGIYQLGDTGGRICLVSPWMSNGNIYQCLQRYPNTNRQHLIMDIARGIAYLHGKSIVHGDLKGANVLISDNGVACLADFGLSSVCIDTPSLAWGTKDSSVSRSTGTLRWQAPELISLEDSPTVKMTTKSDIYAFACVCYEVFVGKMPFYQFQHDVTVITKVISGQRPLPPKPDSKAYQSGLTDWMWSLIEECWDQNPTKRPMISDVVDRLSSREEFLRHGDKDHESWGDLRPEIFRSLLAEDESPVSEADIRNSLSLLHSLNEM
ncbi:kinase-like domain-containing protein [Cyathus striatus]|nr:kinase-like domain-containing protein [Cyathus striatus]